MKDLKYLNLFKYFILFLSFDAYLCSEFIIMQTFCFYKAL